MGASSPLGLWVRAGAPRQVPGHVGASGPAPPRPPPLPLNKVLGSQRGYGLLAGTAASLSLPELEGLGSNILIISTFKLDLIKKGHTPS